MPKMKDLDVNDLKFNGFGPPGSSSRIGRSRVSKRLRPMAEPTEAAVDLRQALDQLMRMAGASADAETPEPQSRKDRLMTQGEQGIAPRRRMRVSRAGAASTRGHATTVYEDDPRACPKDIEGFRVAVAQELDRLREKKTIAEE